MTIIVHGQHIKTPLARRWYAAEIFSSHVGEISSLLRANGGFGRSNVACRTSLDFDKAQYPFMPADDVDLSMLAGRTIIASHHHIPKLPQIKIGVFFAPSAGALVLGRGVGGQELSAQAHRELG